MLLSTRELPAMEAEAEAARRDASRELPRAQVDAHNKLCDDVVALLGAPPPRQPAPKRRKVAGPPPGTVSSEWPRDL